LRAQTAAAGIAVKAQLRADETRLRQSAQRGDVIKDLLKMIAEDRAKMKQEQERGKWFRGGDAAAMALFPREMFTGLNTGNQRLCLVPR